MQSLASHRGLGCTQRYAGSRTRPLACRFAKHRTASRAPLLIKAASSAAVSLDPPQEPVKSFLPFNFPTFLGAAGSVGALLMHLGYLPQVPAGYLVYLLGVSVFGFVWGTISTQLALNNDRNKYRAATASAEFKYAELVNALKSELEKSRQESESRLASSQQQIKEVENSYQAQLNEVKVQLDVAVQQADQTNKELEASYEGQLNEVRAQLEAVLQQADQSNQDASNQLAAAEAQKSADSGSLSQLSEELDASKVKLQALQGDLANSQLKLKEAQEQAKLAAQLGEELQQQKTELQQANASLEAALKEKATAESVMQQLQSSLKAATEQVALLQGKLEEDAAKWKQQLDQQSAELQQAVEARTAAEQASSQLRSNLDANSVQISTLTAEVEASRNTVDDLQAQLKDLKVIKDAELASAQQELADVRAANENASSVASKAAALEKQLKELEKQRQNDQQEITVLRRFADETANESRTLKKQSTAKNEEIIELRRQLVMVNPGRLFDNFKSFGVNTFWTTLVDDFLLKPLERGGKLSNAAIIGPDTGVWGADAGFPPVTRQEVVDISSAISNNSTNALTTKGIVLGKKKYDFTSMKNGVLQGRTWGGGCCITSSAHTLVVGIWNDPINVKPDEVEAQLATVRDYLESVGC